MRMVDPHRDTFGRMGGYLRAGQGLCERRRAECRGAISQRVKINDTFRERSVPGTS